MDIISVILNFLLATGLMGTLIFYRSKARKESAEADRAEIENRHSEFSLQRESVQFLGSQIQEAYAEVDKLQEIINRKRDQIIELISQCKQLEIDLIKTENSRRKAELFICTNMNCTSRCSDSAAA